MKDVEICAMKTADKYILTDPVDASMMTIFHYSAQMEIGFVQ